MNILKAITFVLDSGVVKWTLARIEEPSTWAGVTQGGIVATILAYFGVPAGPLHAALVLGAAFGAFMQVVLPEKK